MADPKKFGNEFLGALSGAARNPDVVHALSGFLRGFAQAGLKKAGVSDDMRKMLHDLGDGAEVAAVAVLQNTPAETTIAPEVAAKAKPVIEHAVATARNDNPGGGQ